jgi:RNA polymerase sigma factor (sigma-70 family)
MIESSAEAVVSPSFDHAVFADDDLDELGDEQLLDLVRLGSGEAYAVLFARYRVAGFRFARYLSNSVDAKDIVSETFAQILHQLRQGRGPDSSFRSYLFTSIRREAGRRAKLARRVSPTDDVAVMDRSVSMFNGGIEGFEREIVRAAFESLPERWQTVLWRMEVDGLKPHEIAPTLGMKPNGVSALAWRAREGLRRAYLHHHIASMPEDRSDAACDEARQRLAGFIRGTATTRDWVLVDSHLGSCTACAEVHLELEEVNTHLGAVSSVIALAFAAPASGILGGLAAKVAILAKSMSATVGTTAAAVAATVTVAQIPAMPPADATTIHARPHQPIQHEPDRAQGPAADRETQPRAEVASSTGESTQTADEVPGTPGPRPLPVQIDERGIKASAGEVGASVDEGGVKASVGGVSASVDEGGVKASVGGVSAAVDEDGVKASVGRVSAPTDEGGDSVSAGDVEIKATDDRSEQMVKNESAGDTSMSKAGADSEKAADTASDVVESE